MANPSEEELRAFPCEMCGATEDAPCRIQKRRGRTNTVCKATLAHQSRHDQLKRAKEGGRWMLRFVPDVSPARPAVSS